MNASTHQMHDQLDGLRADLVGGVATANRRRSRRRTATAAPVLALAAVAMVVFRPAASEPAYAITERSDGTLVVDVLPGFDAVEALTADLEAAGLSVDVIQLRSAPSLDGFVEVVSHANEAADAMRFADSQFVIDLGDVTDPVEILIYTDAGDEPYQAAPSIFAPGEPLAGLSCAFSDRKLSAEELERRASEAGIENITWTVFSELDAETGGYESVEETDERPADPDLAVFGASMADADTLMVFMDPDVGVPADEAILLSDGTHYGQRWDCTPDLAARWE